MGIELIKMTQHGRFHFISKFPNDELQSAIIRYGRKMYLKCEHEKGLFSQTIHIQHKMTDLKNEATVTRRKQRTNTRIKTKSSIDQKI